MCVDNALLRGARQSAADKLLSSDCIGALIDNGVSALSSILSQ